MQLTVLLVAVFVTRYVCAQIPIPCANTESLGARTCCPVPNGLTENAGPCGVNLNRGSCEKIAIPDSKFNASEKDVRKNWPIQYFNMTCVCAERFGGVDCGECSYAYNDGTTECTQKTIRPRKSVSDMTDADWKQYRETLLKAKTSPSRYMIVPIDFKTHEALVDSVIDEALVDSMIDEALVDSMINPTTYDLFTWMHHTAAKDNDVTIDTSIVDFAHEGTGFPTWHQQILLWLEREIQVLINDHEFRLPYWDWTDEDQREILFTRDRLGENINGTVSGEIFDNWTTVCWENIAGKTFPIAICNPEKPTNQSLRRCPNPTLCQKTNINWPSDEDVDDALSIENYDASPYDRFVKETDSSYRNFMEGFIIEDGSDCGSDTMCTTDETRGVIVRRKLHNSVHIILGIGDLKDGPSIPFEKQGVMADVAASPNDPAFVNHHAMVDCIFERWLQENKDNLVYPTSSEIREGHRAQDYIVPIMPLHKQEEMFMTADNFGYTCNDNTNSANNNTGANTIIFTAIMMVILVVSGSN